MIRSLTVALMGFYLVLGVHEPGVANAAEDNYRIGWGRADVTGPAYGIPMWGFSREGQNTEGLHFRLLARAFIMGELDSTQSLVFVSVDIGSITHSMQLEVVDRLQKKYGDRYRIDNVVLSATHTHAGPGGYWHYGAESPLGSKFNEQHFEVIVSGILDAIEQAHDRLEPGSIYINQGIVEDGGANRSVIAYNANPEEERARYDGDTDKEMTVLKFVAASGSTAMVNWFAVHPTAMTYNNRLISGDHKGYASLAFEAAQDSETVIAAFAQTNCGDVTPNLNLDNTGPGENEFETTKIIGTRQLKVATRLFNEATEKLEGTIDTRQNYIDFSGLEVAEAYTKSGIQRTCPSAYGYAFAAGSTEDGGGHPLFKEGMMKTIPMIEGILANQYGVTPPSQEFRDRHAPKAILFALGDVKPHPAQAQILPLGIARIGQFTLLVGPAEFTTMAGRRVRETVKKITGDDTTHIVLSGYSNDYAGYVTTKEEYDTQQYEGGHTLYGPWTLSAYQQEYDRLAKALYRGEKISPVKATPRDLRGKVTSTPIGTEFDTILPGVEFGEVVKSTVQSEYDRGSQAVVTFWSANPQNGFHTGNKYLEIQRQEGKDWTTIATEHDWATRCQWNLLEEIEGTLQMTVTWDIGTDAIPGIYRIRHNGWYRKEGGDKALPYSGFSPQFNVK